MDDEDLQKNPLFNLFQNTEELFSNAAKKSYIVCVPCRGSLKAVKITKDFLLTHVLKTSPYFKEEFVTLNGKNVTISDKFLVAKQGFPRKRTVSIHFEELYYDDDFESFKILHLNYPLEGKVPLSYIRMISKPPTTATPVMKRSIKEHEETLAKILNDEEVQNAVSSAISRFVDDFNNSYVMVKGFLKDAGDKIKIACNRILEKGIKKLQVKGRGRNWPNKIELVELRAAIESLVLCSIHNKLFAGLCKLFQPEDTRSQGAIETSFQSDVTMDKLGVREEIVCEALPAVHRMKTLNACSTPYEKMSCLQNVLQALMSSVNELMLNRKSEMPEEKADVVLSADDIIPMFLYVLLKAQQLSTSCMHYHSNLQYIQNFSPTLSDDASYLQVCIANFHAALQLIDAEINDKKSSSSTGSSTGSTTSRISQRRSSASSYICPHQHGDARNDEPTRNSDSSSGGGGTTQCSICGKERDRYKERDRERNKNSSSNDDGDVQSRQSDSSNSGMDGKRSSLSSRSSSNSGRGSRRDSSSHRRGSGSSSNILSLNGRFSGISLSASNNGAQGNGGGSRANLVARGHKLSMNSGKSKASEGLTRSSSSSSSTSSNAVKNGDNDDLFSNFLNKGILGTSGKSGSSNPKRATAYSREDSEDSSEEEDLGDFLSMLKNSGDVVQGNRNQF